MSPGAAITMVHDPATTSSASSIKLGAMLALAIDRNQLPKAAHHKHLHSDRAASYCTISLHQFYIVTL